MNNLKALGLNLIIEEDANQVDTRCQLLSINLTNTGAVEYNLT